MLWLFFAFLEPMLHAIANIFDTYLANRLFKNTFTLIFYATCTNVLFLPLVWILQRPAFPTVSQLPLFFLLGLAEIGYLYPYYQALKHEDTSIVTSLFSLGKIFVPLLAFFIVEEVLTPWQYLGFIIIIVSGALLTIKEKLRVNRSFWYMALCSLILAFDVVLYKYIFQEVSWSTGFTWGTLSVLVFSLPLIFIIRKDIAQQFSIFKAYAHLFIMEEFLSFAGSAAMTFAISLTSVSLVGAIGSFQPLMVLVYALLFGKYFPRAFREDVTGKGIFKKVILFLVMVVGVWMIVG